MVSEPLKSPLRVEYVWNQIRTAGRRCKTQTMRCCVVRRCCFLSWNINFLVLRATTFVKWSNSWWTRQCWRTVFTLSRQSGCPPQREHRTPSTSSHSFLRKAQSLCSSSVNLQLRFGILKKRENDVCGAGAATNNADGWQLKMAVFWVVAPCRPVSLQTFRRSVLPSPWWWTVVAVCLRQSLVTETHTFFFHAIFGHDRDNTLQDGGEWPD
jgi:hypothetical protein